MTKKTAPDPLAVNPDGSPGLVAPGEIIESSWGNAVSNEFPKVRNEFNTEFARTRSWSKTITGGGAFIPARSDFTGLWVNVPFVAGRVYQATIFVPKCVMTANSEAHLYICNGNGQVLNTAIHTGNADAYFSMFATYVTSPATGDQVVKAMLDVVVGTLTVVGSAEHQSVIVVEEISKTAG